MPPETRSTDRGRPGRQVLLLVGLILLASALAARVQTSGGEVEVRSFVLPTQNGQWVAADLFRPRGATRERPAPLVVVVPGFQRSKETLSNLSIELSRRGIVVIAIDPYAQGESSSSTGDRAATDEGYGLFAVVDYVQGTGNLDYVDKLRVGATGHSAGGNAAIRAASHFGRLATKAGQASRLQAVFVSGYVQTLTDKVLRDVRSNVGISYALYDEGAYRNQNGNGDMRTAPEALRLIGSGLPPDERPAAVEIGRYYGDVADRTLRVVHNEPVIHPFQPYSFDATAHQIEYFERVFDLDPGIDCSDQVWHYKELLTLLSQLCALILLVPLARCLLRLPWFARLVHPIPDAQPRPAGFGAIVFWGVFLVSGAIAFVSYIPLCELSQQVFEAAANRQQTWFFPQRMNNAVMMWAVLNGCVGLVLFFAAHALVGRRRGVEPAMWGIGTSLGELGRTLVLAATLFAAFFALLTFVYYLFHVDYRFLFLGVRPFRRELLWLLPMYLPMFLLFFVQNSLRVNGAMRFAGVPEWRGLLLAGIANTFGLLLILSVQYAVFAITGTVYWTEGWLYVNMLFAVVPIMFVLPVFHRLFFRMTGRIWLGPLTTSAVFVMILLSNTVCYIPL